MGNFDRAGGRGGFGGGRSGGGKSFGGNKSGGFRDKPTMHKAVCDECGKSCEVPFRPSGDKPIFCDNCFSGKREGGRDNGRNDSRSSFAPRASASAADFSKQFTEINDKLNKLISLLEKNNNSNSTVPTEKVIVKDVKKEVKKVATKAVVKEVKKAATKKVVAKKSVTKKK